MQGSAEPGALSWTVLQIPSPLPAFGSPVSKQDLLDPQHTPNMQIQLCLCSSVCPRINSNSSEPTAPNPFNQQLGPLTQLLTAPLQSGPQEPLTILNPRIPSHDLHYLVDSASSHLCTQTQGPWPPYPKSSPHQSWVPTIPLLLVTPNP